MVTCFNFLNKAYLRTIGGATCENWMIYMEEYEAEKMGQA
jgi:hypothetical protein